MSYRPNVSACLTKAERAHLAAIGTPPMPPQPAGTFARQILDRLLIDLSWSSSRLEGNTYSLLDTRRLLEFGEAAAGRLRSIAVGIGGSTYMPLEAPPVIEECFDQILYSAEAIADPFEQAFFVLVQLPYLQPFEDVNKRVSRLAANIPLTFTDVPRAAYNEAVLGVYETKRIDLLKELFLWAYERSAERYKVVRATIGEPDPFRMRHREALREVIGGIVREGLGRKEAFARIAAFSRKAVPAAEREPSAKWPKTISSPSTKATSPATG